MNMSERAGKAMDLSSVVLKEMQEKLSFNDLRFLNDIFKSYELICICLDVCNGKDDTEKLG